MARVVVAGAGAIGASIAYHLAQRGADDVVLADVGEIAGGATGKAMGGVRQQFTTEAEVRLAQASVRLFRGARRAAVRAGRLPLPRDDAETGSPTSRSGARSRSSFGVPVERVDAVVRGRPARRRRARRDDLPRGRDRRPGRRDAGARASRGRARRRGARAHRCARPRRGRARRRLRRPLARGRAARGASSFPSARSSGSSPTLAR